MTSLPAWPQYKGHRENTSSTSFVFTDCFVWSVHSVKSAVFYLLSWRALVSCLISMWIRVLAIWHSMTHTIVAFFVWARSTHAMSSRGKSAGTEFSMKKLCSRLSLFPRKEWQASASRDSGPTAAEERRRMKSWRSQLDLADELERELSFDVHRSRTRASALLGYAQEEQEIFEGEEVETQPFQSSCPAYDELLEVMEHQNIFWP